MNSLSINIYVIINVINAFYVQYFIIEKFAIWKLFKKNLYNFQFDIDKDIDNDSENILFISQNSLRIL